MSTDVAYPVLRTPDLELALGIARCFVEFGRAEYSEVSVSTELHSVAEVRRVARELPAAWFLGACEFDGVPQSDEPPLVAGVRGPGVPDDPAAYEGRLPVRCTLSERPVGSVEDAFTAAVGPNAGEVRWTMLSWPDAPEAGLPGESKHAGVTLLLNTHTRELDEPAGDHTVLVHVRDFSVDGRQQREPYAHWLAERMGLTVIGPGQRC